MLRLQIFIILAIMFGSAFKQRPQSRATFMKNVTGKALTNYVKMYMIYVLCLIATFSCLIFNPPISLKFIVFGWTLLFLIIQWKSSPYIYCFHNFCCHFQLIFVILFCLAMVIRDNIPSLITD